MNELNDQPASPEPKKPQGVPLWTALVALLVIALIGIASLLAVLYYTRSDKARLERQVQELAVKQGQEKLDEKKAADETKRALARNHQDELLAQARNATNAMFQLLGDVRSLASEADSLRFNSAGQRVALYPDLVAQARRFYESELSAVASKDDVIAKLEGVRRIEIQISESVGTTFDPGPDLRTMVQNIGRWADSERQKVSSAQSILGALVRESKVKVTGGTVGESSPTLDEAMRQQKEAESADRQQLITRKTAQAKTEGNATLAQAEAQRVLDQAKAQADRLISEANEIKAQAERESKLRQADTKLADTKADIAARQVSDEAMRQRLRQRASDPAVQATLAPFITPGYWTPEAGYGSLRQIEKKAISLSDLIAQGALNQDARGLQALVRIACHSHNDRPRWNDIVQKGQALNAFLNRPDRLALAAERQKLLIEVAPVLVEMHLLEP